VSKAERFEEICDDLAARNPGVEQTKMIKEWVVVPPAHAAKWAMLAEQALG
jgi:hypothetical protein